MKDTPQIASWIYYNNIRGTIKVCIGKKYYIYHFKNDVSNIMRTIKNLFRYKPFSAISIAKKLSYKTKKGDIK